MILMMLMMGLGLIVPLILIGVVAYALGFRPQLNQTKPAETSQTPLDILKARYARGEITGAEYDQMSRALQG
jgi:uncharacterized membrane protein